MESNYGSFFRKLRTDKNISISSLADEYISKGMISKFERDESEISVSRFYHLLNKIRVRSNEFELAKNMYNPSGFEALLREIQKYTLEENYVKLKKIALSQLEEWNRTNSIYSYLNYIMVIAIVNNHDDVPTEVEHIDFLINYLFKCENWGLYELILYSNSMSILPIETILVFSKSLPQKILLLKDASNILEITINAIINTLILCIEHNREEEGFFFIKVIEDFSLSETMIFERMLFNLYKGVFISKFSNDKQLGNKLIKDSLSLLQLAGCDNLYDILLEDSKKLLV